MMTLNTRVAAMVPNGLRRAMASDSDAPAESTPGVSYWRSSTNPILDDVRPHFEGVKVGDEPDSC
jgi:hypothetical protein